MGGIVAHPTNKYCTKLSQVQVKNNLLNECVKSLSPKKKARAIRRIEVRRMNKYEDLETFYLPNKPAKTVDTKKKISYTEESSDNLLQKAVLNYRNSYHRSMSINTLPETPSPRPPVATPLTRHHSLILTFEDDDELFPKLSQDEFHITTCDYSSISAY